ncbi:MAG: hypothetical protein ACR2OE_19255 [Thermomicrobiales bacterium]
MIEWFHRLADIPDIGYLGDPRVQRSALPDWNTVPKIVTHSFDGQQHTSLSWPTKEGATSASPASRYATTTVASTLDMPTALLLRHLSEVLELPGTTSDFHFAIQNCIEQLWKRRRQEPGVLPEIERMCLLDLSLIDAHPKSITNEVGREPKYFLVHAFGHLIHLYERNGYLVEALAIARRATRYEQDVKLEAIEARLALVEAEAL